MINDKKYYDLTPYLDNNGFARFALHTPLSSWVDRVYRKLANLDERHPCPRSGDTLDTSWPWRDPDTMGTYKYYYRSAGDVFIRRISKYIKPGWYIWNYEKENILFKFGGIRKDFYDSIEIIGSIFPGEHYFRRTLYKNITIGVLGEFENLTLEASISISEKRPEPWKGINIQRTKTYEEFLSLCEDLGVLVDSISEPIWEVMRTKKMYVTNNPKNLITSDKDGEDIECINL